MLDLHRTSVPVRHSRAVVVPIQRIHRSSLFLIYISSFSFFTTTVKRGPSKSIPRAAALCSTRDCGQRQRDNAKERSSCRNGAEHADNIIPPIRMKMIKWRILTRFAAQLTNLIWRKQTKQTEKQTKHSFDRNSVGRDQLMGPYLFFRLAQGRKNRLLFV